MIGIILLTLRELTAKKITLGLFLVSTLVWLMLSFALNLDIVDGTLAGMRIFGQTAMDSDDLKPTDGAGNPIDALTQFVIGIEQAVAGASYWMGILLALFATAPLINGMLERGRVDLLLSKPISRNVLLGSHIIGVLVVVFILAIYLMGMVWLVMSIKSGIWNGRFLYSVFMVLIMFSVMYSVVLLIGVSTQSTALSLIVTYGLIFSSLILAARDEILKQITPAWRGVYEGFYHVLPNFAEVTVPVVKLVAGDTVESWYPLLSSIAFGAVIYVLAFLKFNRRDF